MRNINCIVGVPLHKLFFSPNGNVRYKIQNMNLKYCNIKILSRPIIDKCGYVLPLMSVN